MDSRDGGSASSFASPASAEGSCESIYPKGSALKAFRRRLLSPIFRISDTGFCGLHRLRTHIVICGFGRSGTTLLPVEHVEADVGRDAVEPGAQGRAALEAIEAAPRPHECLLDGVLRLERRSEHAVAEPGQLAPVRLQLDLDIARRRGG